MRSNKEILRKNEKQLRYILDVIPLSCMVINQKNYQITLANAFALEKIESTSEVLLESHISLLMPDFFKVFDPRKISAEEYKQKQVETVLYTSTRKKLNVLVSIVPLDYHEAGDFLLSFFDFTHFKRVQLERKELENQMQQAQKLESLGVLAGGIAHDFNNILTSILGNSDMLLQDIPEAHVEERNCLLEIKASTERAADLARQMLAYSGKGPIHTSGVDLNKVILDMEALLEVSVSKKVAIRFDCKKQIPLILGDPLQIHQIIMNLVSNASEAIGANPGVINIATSQKHCNKEELRRCFIQNATEEGEYIILEISDTGCGIDRHTLKRIFDPFFSTRFTGRGLGLSAVLGIVRAHNASLHVESEVGEGSSFSIYFPAASLNEEKEKIDIEQEDERADNLLILLVDDEISILKMVERMLVRYGYQVITAENGSEAIDIFKEKNEEIGCVILDLTMPKMDGEEAFYELQKINNQIPVIISSGYHKSDIGGRFRNGGPAFFLQKPYHGRELKQVLKKCIQAARINS